MRKPNASQHISILPGKNTQGAGMPSSRDVPKKAIVRKGRVLFGLTESGDRVVIALPRFSSTGCDRRMLDIINKTPRLRQDDYCETLLRRHMGSDYDKRIIFQDGDLVPLDQDAATMLWEKRFTLRANQYHVPLI